MRRLLVLAALLLTACAYPVVVTPDFSALTPQPTATPTPTVTTPEAAATARATGGGEEAYYRGVYDICVWLAAQTGRALDCLAFVKRARAADWYGQASPGWSWRDVAPELLSY